MKEFLSLVSLEDILICPTQQLTSENVNAKLLKFLTGIYNSLL